MTKVLAKAVLKRGDKILVLRRSKTDTRRPGEWDLAGGAVDESERIEDACVREVQEEAGLTISADDLELLYAHTEFVDDFGNICWLIFGVDAPDGDIIVSHEHDEFAWVTLEESLTMVTYDRQLIFLRHIFEHDLLK